MSRKTIGYVLIALGVVITVVSLAADTIGIGNRNGFGYQQLLGTFIGIVVAIAVMWLAFKKPEVMK